MTYIDFENTPQHYGHVNDGTLNEDDQGRIQCPSCGIWKKHFCIIDIRDFPASLKDGFDWLCDGCWNEWLRPGGSGQKQHQGTPLTKKSWLVLHGAPQTALDRQDNSDMERLKQLEAEGLSDRDISKHMDVKAIRLKRNKL